MRARVNQLQCVHTHTEGIQSAKIIEITSTMDVGVLWTFRTFYLSGKLRRDQKSCILSIVCTEFSILLVRPLVDHHVAQR